MLLDFDKYDKIIISTSGGKDSLACILYFLDQGIDKSRMELWHQAVDGRHNSFRQFYDWKCTDGYVQKVARHLGLSLSYQWRAFGMYGEMTRENALTNDCYYEVDNNIIRLPTTKGKLSTRKKFPAKTADLKTRWCSAYLKIDVARKVISNRFKEGKFLFVTGERREESPQRARYNEYELHPSNNKLRLVHSFRPVIDWKESKVWDIIEKYGIVPHPAYYLGFPRVSCMRCVFYSPNHWRTLQDVDPSSIHELSELEKEFSHTIDNKFPLLSLVQKGKTLLLPENRQYVKLALSEYDSEVSTNKWILPAGAFGSGGGSL
ncbi:MAG TPA: phosphoadenosine phosphosulfate reductase family protein [Ignavibacteriales bacterium]|nr:phosphoadenosine phosphosulfate reductase family protein [Ignavibacteriales bacterium]